jgi:hypothetical protein
MMKERNRARRVSGGEKHLCASALLCSATDLRRREARDSERRGGEAAGDPLRGCAEGGKKKKKKKKK